MSNIRILESNAADTGTISVSPSPELSASNMQNDLRGSVCRVLGDTMQIDIDLERGQYADAIIIARHNFSALATWKREIWTGRAQTGVKVYDQAAELIEPPTPWGEFVWGDGPWAPNRYSEWALAYAVEWLPQRVVASSIRLTITDPGAAFLQASRIMIGTVFSPTYNASYGHSAAWQDLSEQTRTEGGSLRSDARETFRSFELSLEWLSPADRSRMMELARKIGTRKDTFISLYPGSDDASLERDYMATVKLKEAPPITASVFNLYQNSLSFVET